MKRARYTPEEGHSVTIATKVSQSDKQKLCAIAEGFGLSFFGLLQALLAGIIRYFDKGSLISYESNVLLNALGNIFLKDGAGILSIAGRKNQRVNSAILSVEDKKGEQPQLLEVRFDKDGQTWETYNHDTMLTTFLRAADPEVLEVLKNKCQELGYFSITHTLHDLILKRESNGDTMKADIDELFSDIRTPTGARVNSDVFYKRKQNSGEYTTLTPKKTYRADL